MSKRSGSAVPLEESEQPAKVLKKSHSKIALFLEEEEHSDATIECDGIVWPVHKFKLAEHSHFFDKAFSKKKNEWKVLKLI